MELNGDNIIKRLSQKAAAQIADGLVRESVLEEQIANAQARAEAQESE